MRPTSRVTKVPAIRASCSAMPATRRRTSCRLPFTIRTRSCAAFQRHAKQGEGDAAHLGPDSKSQVTVRYVDGHPSEVTQIVLSTQHLREDWDSDKVREVVEPYIREALGDLPIADDCNWYINPTGKFVIGGPDGDAGLTGRQIIVDTYGGAAPHGGGAFSGKDTTKVDRSAAYMARYLAKNIVAAKLAERCTLQLSYAIGVAQPLSVYLDFHGTGKVSEELIEKILPDLVDLSADRNSPPS